MGTSRSFWGTAEGSTQPFTPCPNPSGHVPQGVWPHPTPQVEGLDGGGCEPWAGACRGRGHLHPPNSDISLREWLEALKPTSSLSLCTNSQAAAPVSPDRLWPVVNNQKIMCPELIAASTAASIFSCLALAVCSSLTLLRPALAPSSTHTATLGASGCALLPAT